MGRQVSARRRRLAEEDAETVREDYVKKMRDNYPHIIRTLMHDLIVSIDKNGNLVFLNDAAVEFWGKPSEEIIGTPFSDYLHPEDVDKTHDTIQEMIKSKGQVKGLIVRVKSPRGTRKIAWNAVAIFDDEENYIGAQATGKDLTDLLRTEEELKWSKRQFQSLFEVLVDPVVIVDMNGKILELSQSAEEILGFSKDELVGKHFLETDAATAESKAIMAKNLEKLKTGLYIEPHPIEVITKDGKKLLYELNTARINHKGEPAILAIFRNITEQKKVEEKLQASEERFNYFLENAPEAIWVQDLIGTFLDGNKKAEELTGYKREELIGKNMLEILVSPESVPRLMEAFKPNKLGEISGPTELELIKKDGSLVSVEASIIPVERDGKIEIIGITRDITDRKKAEEALRRSEEEAKRLLEFQNKVIDTANAWVNLVDLKGNVILWNRAAELVSGYSREEVIGHNKMWKWLYPDPNYRAKIFNIGKELSERGKRLEDFDSIIKCKDGSLKSISWYATNVLDEKGKPAGSVAVGIDVTERKKAQEAINKANRLLKQSNKELESYTYVVSHDLKAPLRTIKSFGSFLLEDYGDKLDETGKDYLNRMVNASSRMDSMIEDLLILSRVGRKFTEFEKGDLNKLLEEILDDLEARIKEHNTKVVVDKLPALFVQRIWMRQLFMNLINNALKFSESKTPKIEVLHEEREKNHLFKVRDNGIGIEEKYLERIFNLFERAPTEKKYDGTGAGLSICKKIVEHLGGKIWVESTPGKGSTFMFTIPKEIKK